MGYVILKYAHVTLALVSVTGFIVRWSWMMRGSNLSQSAWARTWPHLLDTAFLATGIVLAVQMGASPLNQPWLAAKIAGLVLYVILGSLALKRARTVRGKQIFFVLALGVFAWVVSVARLKSPLGFFLLT